MEDPLEKILKEAEEESRKAVAEGIDQGHNALLGDLEEVLNRARALEYHDFLSKEGTPKVNLAQRLEVLRQRTIDGVYDN